MMKYYKYSFMGYMFDHTAGIVIANSVREAKQKVREYYKNTGDTERLKKIFDPLMAYHIWL